MRYIYGFLLVGTWIISTDVVIQHVFHRVRTIYAHVDIVNVGTYLDQTDQSSPIEMFVQGSDELHTNTIYWIDLRITFLCSWKTATSGMITLVTNFGRGKQTVVSFFPYTHTMLQWWVLNLISLGTGLINDSFDRQLTITTDFKSTDFISSPIQPVHNTHSGYIARVCIIPGHQSNLPDMLEAQVVYKSVETSYLWHLLMWVFIVVYAYITVTLCLMISFLCIFHFVRFVRSHAIQNIDIHL